MPKKKQKKEEIIKRQKIKTMIVKCCRIRKKINSSNIEEENYEGDTKDNIDLNKSDNKYLS